MNLEEYLDEEYRLLRVTPHITHLRGDGYYHAITVASQHHEPYRTVDQVLTTIMKDLDDAKRTDYGAYIINAFAQCGRGVALCHHLDQFNRQRGRIIAKGRLFKLLRKERAER